MYFLGSFLIDFLALLASVIFVDLRHDVSGHLLASMVSCLFV